jgi:hypothetical protein
VCGNIYEYVNVYVVICGGGRSCTYVKLVALEQTIYLISRTPPVDSILYVGVLYVVYNNLLLCSSKVCYIGSGSRCRCS